MTVVEFAGATREFRPDLHVLLATNYAKLPSGATSDLPRLARPFRKTNSSLRNHPKAL